MEKNSELKAQLEDKELIMTKQAAAQAVIVAKGLFKLFPLAKALQISEVKEGKSNG